MDIDAVTFAMTPVYQKNCLYSTYVNTDGTAKCKFCPFMRRQMTTMKLTTCPFNVPFALMKEKGERLTINNNKNNNKQRRNAKECCQETFC